MGAPQPGRQPTTSSPLFPGRRRIDLHATLEVILLSRIKAVKALLGATLPDAEAEELSEAEADLRDVLGRIHDPAGQADWQSLAEAVSIAVNLKKWYRAVRLAEEDPDQFLRAAKLQFAEWQTAGTGYGHDLKACFSSLGGVLSPAGVASILEEAARVPFPARIFNEEPPG